VSKEPDPQVFDLPFDRTWTPKDVSRFLGVPVATLHQWRYLGTGPKAAKVGRHLRYLPADVLDWFRQQQEAA
jgi:DNA-binding transcriptional MerR regulator